MLSAVEQTRLQISEALNPRKSQLGQFFTPERTAGFMAGLFPDGREFVVLDAGAGIGSLSAAFLDRWQMAVFTFRALKWRLLSWITI